MLPILSKVFSTSFSNISIFDGDKFRITLYFFVSKEVTTSKSNSTCVLPPVILLGIKSFFRSRSVSPNIAKYIDSAIDDLPIALRLSGLSLLLPVIM